MYNIRNYIYFHLILFIIINIKIFVSTGGWALVFAVEDIKTGKEYALKVNHLFTFILF